MIYDWLIKFRKSLGMAPTHAQDSRTETAALVEDACRTVERVNTKREEWHQQIKDKPDIAKVLLLARDRD